jgi:localization factor PodJL
MSHVPWHVKGVGPDARDVARDAARRSGLSVGEWLNTLIIDAAGDDDAPPTAYQNPTYGEPDSYDRDRSAHGSEDRFAAITRQIEELKSQIDRLAPNHATRPGAGVVGGQ